MIQGLRTTVYHVGDIEKGRKFYSEAFEKEPYFNEPFYVGFNIEGFELGLQPEDSPVTGKKLSVVSYWGVEDIEAEYQRLISIGAKEHEKPQNVGGDIMVASVLDPWENIIGIIYNPHFKK